MRASEVPEPVRAAAAAHPPPPPPVRREARRGDFAVVAHENVTRIVCVTQVTDSHLVAVLCSNEVEMATDRDVVVHRPGTYDLLIEAACHLVVLPAQVCGIVGSVDLDVVNAVRDGERVDGFSVGLPLCGVVDPRWEFMEHELDDVVVLRDLAHRVLLDGWNPGRRGPTRTR